nr:hypothetical protein Iba_chr13aCG11750 [Ipomoea batatas]
MYPVILFIKYHLKPKTENNIAYHNHHSHLAGSPPRFLSSLIAASPRPEKERLPNKMENGKWDGRLHNWVGVWGCADVIRIRVKI